MAPASIFFRGGGGGGGGGGGRVYNYSLFLYKRTLNSYHLFNNNESISTNLLRSFTTTSTSNNDFDDLFHSNDNPKSSSSPPHPIPNRPLRADNTFNNKTRQQTSPQFAKPFRNENPKRDAAGAAFLEKFKLGFEKKDNNEDGGKVNSMNVESNANAGRRSEAKVEVEDADEIFKKMKETGLIPNAVAMLDGLCKDGLVQEAMKLFGLMREKGTVPEVVIYTAVVEGFCKAHKFEDAVRIFRKMQSNNVVPNAFSYGLLIQWLCKGKRLDDAVEFSVEMLDAGHSLNLATFTGLVDGFCREKGLEDAKGLISTLRQKGFYFDEKAVKEYLDKKGPFLPAVWEAIIGKKSSQRSSLFD